MTSTTGETGASAIFSRPSVLEFLSNDTIRVYILKNATIRDFQRFLSLTIHAKRRSQSEVVMIPAMTEPAWKRILSPANFTLILDPDRERSKISKWRRVACEGGDRAAFWLWGAPEP